MQQRRLQKLNGHFKNLLGNLPAITDKPTEEITNDQLDLKLRPFTKDELNTVLKVIKSSKVAGLDEMTPKVWKTRKFDGILFILCNAICKQNAIEKLAKGGIFLIPEIDILRTTKNYWGITLTAQV